MSVSLTHVHSPQLHNWCDLHEIMDTREREKVVQFVSHNAPILVMLLLAVSSSYFTSSSYQLPLKILLDKIIPLKPLAK